MPSGGATGNMITKMFYGSTVTTVSPPLPDFLFSTLIKLPTAAVAFATVIAMLDFAFFDDMVNLVVKRAMDV